jgi:serine/threonine-protein kinase
VLGSGTTIGAYRVVQPLGQGGMGTVYLGEHALLGRRAAIKVLLPALSANEELVARFFNEARAVTLISDPGIVQIFDFGHHTDGSAFIVMELLEGEPMDARLRRAGRFGMIECLRLARLICTSLEAAHAKRIIHRDLKPENIFIVPDPAVPGGERAKILDFGIAKLSEDEPGRLQTRTDAVMGTPMFMSPEQCRGGGAIDHRSDVYAMGCVMFTMLTCRPPFDGMGAGELIAAHLREPPPLLSSRIPDVPGVIEEILQCCLRKSPDERFRSMAELARALGSVEQALVGTAAANASAASGSWPPIQPGLAMPTPAQLRIPTPGAMAAPMPTPGAMAAPMPRPTTTNHSHGQVSSPTPVPAAGRPRRGSARWIAASVVVGALVAIVVIAAALRGPGAAIATVPEPPPVVRSGAPEGSVVAPSPAAPAAPVPAPPPPNALTMPVTAVTTVTDAGVADTVIPAAAIDAGAPPRGVRPASKLARPSSTGRDHEGTGSAAPPHIDRGD